MLANWFFYRSITIFVSSALYWSIKIIIIKIFTHLIWIILHCLQQSFTLYIHISCFSIIADGWMYAASHVAFLYAVAGRGEIFNFYWPTFDRKNQWTHELQASVSRYSRVLSHTIQPSYLHNVHLCPASLQQSFLICCHHFLFKNYYSVIVQFGAHAKINWRQRSLTHRCGMGYFVRCISISHAIVSRHSAN